MEVRQRHTEGSGASGNGRVTDTLSQAQMRGLELDDDDFKDFKALLKDARNINSGSYAFTIIREVLQFCLDEGNPIIFPILIMNIFGENSWYKLSVPLVINLFTSFVIAYYLTVEKHEVAKLKQGSDLYTVVVDSCKKFTSLIIHFCIEGPRRTKRTEKLEIIENAIHKDRNGNMIWISEEGFLTLVKYYSSQLRYQKEELLIATLRSSVLVVYNIHSLADTAHFALPVCRINDCFKVLYILWIVFKVSDATYSFDKIKLRYVAATQLWAKIRLRTNANGSENCLDTPSFSCIVATEDSMTQKGLNLTMYYMSTFSRFVAATLLIITSGLLGLLVWIIIIVGFNYLLLELKCSEENVRSVFDNPPTGYTTNRNRLISRFLSTFLFYNHGYTRYYQIPRRTCLTISFSVVFYLTILFVKGGHIFRDELFSFSAFFYNENDIAKEFHCASYGRGNSTWYNAVEKIQCFQNLLRTEPIDALEFIGGLSCSSIFLIFFPIVTFMIELFCVHDKIMEDFDKFPFLDAADCIRSLINGVLDEANDLKNRNLFVLLLGSSEDFESLNKRLSHCQCTFPPLPFQQQNEKEFVESEDDVFSEFANDIICKNVISTTTTTTQNPDFNTLRELASEQILRFGEYHPLCFDIRRLFDYLFTNREYLMSLGELELFIIFCRHINQVLCQLSSSRLERTFYLLDIDLVKTYE